MSKIHLLANLGYMSLDGEFGNLCHRSIRRMPSNRKLSWPQHKPCDPDACPPLRSFRIASPHTGQTGPMLLHLHLRFFDLGFVDQPRNPVVFW
jgi:hypothetical protein